MSQISAPKTVDSLLSNTSINRTRNDRTAHLRFGGPVAQQYTMDVREARKLSAAIAQLPMPKAALKAVVQELAKRATMERSEMPRFGGLKLSENAAKELDKLAKKLGVDVDFKHGQPFPLHPVG